MSIPDDGHVQPLQAEMPSTIKKFAFLDAIVILVLICGAVVSLPLLRSSSPALVVVYRDNRIIARYPLDQDHHFILTGAVGPVEIAIAQKRVRVIFSTCPKGICTHSMPIGQPGQQIVCVPNHMLIEIAIDKQHEDVDAVNQ
jgi:hypothetical protein